MQVIFIRAWCHLSQLVTEALDTCPPEHQQVLAEAFYRGATTATIAPSSGYPTEPPGRGSTTPCTPYADIHSVDGPAT